MSVLDIIQYQADKLDKGLVDNLRGASALVFGTSVQNPTQAQLIKDSSYDALQLLSGLGPPLGVTQIHTDVPASVGPWPSCRARAPLVEYVRTFFSAADVTSAFQAKIEADFKSFEDTYRPGLTGELGHFWGWTAQEEAHEGIPTRSFILVRGWESMEHFERSVDTEAFRKSIPLLYAWGAPFEMRHVQNQLRE